MMNKPTDTDAYIASFAASLQPLLQKLRATIKAAVPEAAEIISYGMPAYKQNGMIAWFACHTNHIGLYMRPATKEVFIKELSKYKGSKSSVHFGFDEVLPLDLITRVVQYQTAENFHKKTVKKPKLISDL